VAARFRIPLHPICPSLAVLANIFLISSLDKVAYIRFAVWLVLAVAVYLLYGLHHTHEESPQVELATLEDASPPVGTLDVKAAGSIQSNAEIDEFVSHLPGGSSSQSGGVAGKGGYRAVSMASPRSRDSTPRSKASGRGNAIPPGASIDPPDLCEA
jgi:hypothetical protein